VLAVLPAAAHDVITTKITWSREVSRIVYKHCISCHHEGGAAFSLVAYAEARPWAKAIKEEVLARRMPPWNAVKGFGEFKDDHGLTQEDLEVISDWVEGGAPEGNPIVLPKPDLNAQDENATPAGQSLAVTGSLVLKQAVAAIGIVAAGVPANGTVQAIAQRPDGSIEPLVWIEKFNPGYDQPYFFRSALRLPAGTEILLTPATASVKLIVQKPRSKS
jgi:hypothetical protein